MCTLLQLGLRRVVLLVLQIVLDPLDNLSHSLLLLLNQLLCYLLFILNDRHVLKSFILMVKIEFEVILSKLLQKLHSFLFPFFFHLESC